MKLTAFTNVFLPKYNIFNLIFDSNEEMLEALLQNMSNYLVIWLDSHQWPLLSEKEVLPLKFTVAGT